MQLSDLKRSISEMSDEELHALLNSIRSYRRVTKRPTAQARKATTSSSKVSTNTLLDALSPEQAAELLKILGG